MNSHCKPGKLLKRLKTLILNTTGKNTINWDILWQWLWRFSISTWREARSEVGFTHPLQPHPPPKAQFGDPNGASAYLFFVPCKERPLGNVEISFADARGTIAGRSYRTKEREEAGPGVSNERITIQSAYDQCVTHVYKPNIITCQQQTVAKRPVIVKGLWMTVGLVGLKPNSCWFTADGNNQSQDKAPLRSQEPTTEGVRIPTMQQQSN